MNDVSRSPIRRRPLLRRAGLALRVAAGLAACAGAPTSSSLPAPAGAAAGTSVSTVAPAIRQALAPTGTLLFELADGVPGARVLDGRWGLEHLAIAVPKGRYAAAYLRDFADAMRSSGRVG